MEKTLSTAELEPETLRAIKKLSGRPCVQCGKPSQLVGAFRPKKPSNFGIRPGEEKALFFPCCKACCAAGLDYDLMELEAAGSLGFPVVT